MSLTNKYNKEAILIDRLWQLTQNGTNYSNSILYLEIVGKALSVSDIEIYGSSKDENIYRYVKIFLVLTDELKNLRSNMWKSLGILLQQNKYTQYIYQILIKTLSTYNELHQDELKAFLLSDLESIFSYVINSNEPNFDDAMIVYKYNNIASNNGIIIDPCYHIENAAFKFYKLLNFKPLPQKNYAESMKCFKDMIEEEIKSYKLNDFKELFYKIRNIPEQKRCNLKHGGNVIFELLEKDPDLYQQVLTEYLEEGDTLGLKGNRPINYLLDHIGYKKTYDLINRIKFESKDDWLLLIWESVKDKDINEKIVSDFHKFIENYLKKNNNNFSPSINMLNKYCKNYSNYTKEIIQAIINNQVISYNFIQSVYVEDKIDDCLRFFNNNLDLLGEIYINAKRIDKWIDYNGKIFTGIFQASPLIWNNYVTWLNDDINNYRYDQLTSEQPIFDLVWQTQEWNKHIDYAYTVMIDTNIVIEQQAQLLFNQSNNDSIMNKKKHWLLDSLHKRINNIDYCKKIIEVVVYAMPDFKKEFILEFLKENKNIEDFKKINLFPMNFISTGIESEISFIQDKITFLQELKECLYEMNNCIQHKHYLSEEISALEVNKKELELNKYI